MRFFLFNFGVSFLTIAGIGLFINFCRRRLQNTKHGLTGMCHKDGGTMCCSCSANMVKRKK